MPGAFTQVIVIPDFVLCSLASQTSTGIPLIRLDSHSECVVSRKLFLTQIGRFSQFIILATIEIVDVR